MADSSRGIRGGFATSQHVGPPVAIRVINAVRKDEQTIIFGGGLAVGLAGLLVHAIQRDPGRKQPGVSPAGLTTR